MVSGAGIVAVGIVSVALDKEVKSRVRFILASQGHVDTPVRIVEINEEGDDRESEASRVRVSAVEVK